MLRLHPCPPLFDAFKRSTLPFTHYYVYGSGEKVKVIEPQEGKWIITFLEELRAE